MEGDNPVVMEPDAEEDKGSNNGAGSTASHSSEEFVKVNQDDASIDDAAGDVANENVEDIPLKPVESTEAGFGESLMSKIDPRADFESESPVEVANIPAGSSVLESALERDGEELVGNDTHSIGSLGQGGHLAFEPAPASSFIPNQALVGEPELASCTSENDEMAQDGDGGGVASTTATSSSDTADVKEHAGGVISIEDVVPSDDEEVPSPLEETGRNDVEDSLLPIPGAGPGQEKVQEFDRSDPVVNLIYWRDIKKTAVVFTSILLILFSLICHSVISVAAYASLAILTVTVGFRLYRLVLQTLNGTQQPHPFQAILDVDLSLSPERAEKYASVVSSHVNCVVSQFRDLLLVKATLSSLKFGVCLWLLTYIGALFNGLTLLIIDVIFIFTVPPVYEKYQVQIDGYYGVAKDKMDALVANIKAKMPGKKEKTQ